jgi:hypothetical protein
MLNLERQNNQLERFTICTVKTQDHLFLISIYGELLTIKKFLSHLK